MRTLFVVAALAVLGCSVSIGCGSSVAPAAAAGVGGDSTAHGASGPTSAVSGSTGSGAGGTCTDFASVVCSKAQQCDPQFVEFIYGDEATCAMRDALACSLSFGAPGSNSAAIASACAAAYQVAACDDLLDAVLDACKPVPGDVAEGGSCLVDEQCASTYCSGVDGPGKCGVCALRVPLGGACSDSYESCVDGAQCESKSMTCKAALPDGAACGPGTVCAAGLHCLAGACGKYGTNGAPCDASHPCDELLSCNVQMMLCETVGLADAGQPCGLVNGAFAVCKGGGHCAMKMAMPSGTCDAPIQDGAPCPDGDGCLSPAYCFGGVCTVPDPSLCN